MALTAVLELILKRRRINYAVKIHKETGESSNVLVVTKGITEVFTLLAFWAKDDVETGF